MIHVQEMTLKYPSGKGVFDLDFSVEQGMIMGYLGPNGAGKTTTIRGLMGFMRPLTGQCTIKGLDCFSSAPEIQRFLGYIPGEMAFMDNMDGQEFLDFMSDMRKTSDKKRQKALLDRFELDPRGKIKKFSKGMRQKLGIVTAFMHDPDVLLLDEPTSGLDPLMQSRFIAFALEEKARGKTILMSSHHFEEVERTCDQVIIIKDGRILEQSDVQTLKSAQRKGYLVKTKDLETALHRLESEGFEATRLPDDTLEIFITGEQVDRLVKVLATLTVLDISVKVQTLEDVFMKFYGREGL